MTRTFFKKKYKNDDFFLFLAKNAYFCTSKTIVFNLK